MGRINSYPKISRPNNNDEIIIDGPNGTQNITMANLSFSLSGMLNAINHRMIVRGKNLGDQLTESMKSSIRNGDFDDIFIGDYFYINGTTWRVVDIDYWYGRGDPTQVSKHHIVIMPDVALYNAKMNDEKSTDGGYVNSKMYNEGLTNAKYIIEQAFGYDNILEYYTLLSNAVNDGSVTATSWNKVKIALPNEPMIFGHYIMPKYSNPQSLITSDPFQLSLFAVQPSMSNKSNIWLRDVVSDTTFSALGISGSPLHLLADLELPIRPIVGITGGD